MDRTKGPKAARWDASGRQVTPAALARRATPSNMASTMSQRSGTSAWGVDRVEALRVLSRLVENHQLVRVGERRGVEYALSL